MTGINFDHVQYVLWGSLHDLVRLWRLKPINPHQRQHPRKDRPQADQHHEQFEKICQELFMVLSNSNIDLSQPMPSASNWQGFPPRL
jgi:hypothetical protein